MIFLLAVRLLEKNPTFYQLRPSELYLFCEKGVYILPANMIITPSELMGDCVELGVTLDYTNGPIFLIDSNTALVNPPAIFCERYVAVFVVQAASPSNRGAWMKGREAEKYTMNPWTWSEIVAG